MFGILNCDKPLGITSRSVVNAVHRQVRPCKAGHAGTLDPLATGVLLVPVGQAVRLTSYLQELPKEYCGVFRFGVQTASGDLELTPEPMENAPIPTLEQVEVARDQFLGDIEQVPPAHSAIKIDGQRAYRLARQGQDVKMKPRKVRIDTIEILRYEYPDLHLRIVCGSGTYIRSLGVDLAAACGTVAVMTSLRRTAIGDFRVEQAHTLDEIREGDVEGMLQSPLLGLPTMPHVCLRDDELLRIEQGQILSLDPSPLFSEADEEIAAIDENQRLRALLCQKGGGWRAKRGFPLDAEISCDG
ncbi:tRNA pseudouridine synthase B [Roseimaritima multifibrata]|uniref:tRNA pseudouridine synthase B n=1 Tax=Roseimaritima multifibrata TaxID=1930274 RepID=A0A517MLG5_9BACT|nr:tRNA pseudouridine(55) synthase TruB [Roseimaritima multifibrata]QDS95607.1 tRNA pseudouridine synthase B [Roseimaritima multifibrata]